MTDPQACYRELHKYKYQLVQDYNFDIAQGYNLKQKHNVDTDFIALTTAGQLTIKNCYAWDGPSGPTIDTKSFMRGSLVHDALYQLMRSKDLDYVTQREAADDLLRDICKDDGMWRFRAWYVHQAVRKFGEGAARPSPAPRDVIICVP